MQVTITGGTGSLAEFVIKELEDKHDLVLFDRVKPGENRFAYEIKHPVVVGDLTDFEACQRAVEGSQAIIHLGAIPYPTEHPALRAQIEAQGRPLLPFDETMRVNIMGTYYLMEAARRAGVKTVVMASSNCALGHGFRLSERPFPYQYLPIDESHPLDYEDTYSLSKYVNEETLRAFSNAYGMRCYALRPAGIWRVERQIEYAKSYKPAEAWSDWLYVYVDIRDMARAFRMCFEAADTLPPFDTFYVNAPDSLQLEDTRPLVERLRPDLLPKLRDIEGRQALISPAKAERRFGFRAKHSWIEHLP